MLATPIFMAFFVSLLLSDNSWEFAYYQYFTIKSTLKIFMKIKICNMLNLHAYKKDKVVYCLIFLLDIGIISALE